MNGESVALLVPLVCTTVVAFGTAGKGVRYVKAIFRAFGESI